MILSACTQRTIIRDCFNTLQNLSCVSPVFTAELSVSEICLGGCQPIRGKLSVSPIRGQRWGLANVVLVSTLCSPSWSFGFGTSLGLGLGGLDLGLGLFNKPEFYPQAECSPNIL